MDFSRSGKFWFDAKTGNSYVVRGGHHTLIAFEIPETAKVIRDAVGKEEFTKLYDDVHASSLEFFSGSVERYLELDDMIGKILNDAGFIRGMNDLVFYLSLSSRYERACRELVTLRNPSHVEIDLTDTQQSITLSGVNVELFIRGRSLKTFVRQ